MASATDVAAVDQFLSSQKHLYGAPPEFGRSNFQRKGKHEWQASWPIADSLGMVTSAQLRFVARPGIPERHSVSVIYNGQCVTRLDFAPSDECESNPVWAKDFGLPAVVCGPHMHSWEHNRAHVLVMRLWELPCRLPLQPQIRRFAQAFPWLAAEINIMLTPEQRDFSLPAELI